MRAGGRENQEGKRLALGTKMLKVELQVHDVGGIQRQQRAVATDGGQPSSRASSGRG